MNDDEDPYFKLRPLGPTPPEEILLCEGSLPVVLASDFGANPISCLKCNGEVPPERIGFSAEVAQEIAYWRTFYAAFDTLWLDSAEFEDWARAQLSDVNSVVNVRGMQVTARLNESRRAYLSWFQEPGEDDFEPLTDCPRCGAALVSVCERLVCEPCSIAVYN